MKKFEVTFDIKKTCQIPYGTHTEVVEANNAKQACEVLREKIETQYGAHAFHTVARLVKE